MGQLRRNLYKSARILGDIQASEKGPAAYAKRRARRTVYRTEGRWTRKLLRSLGL
jgi:hypothetical protein